jgi:hypothetical protein
VQLLSPMQTIKISRDTLPTGQIEVDLKPPTYGDLRKARRLYPFDKAEKGETIGYLPDDLLLTSLLVKVNGQPTNESIDLIDRLKEIPLPDRQALSLILVDAFFLSKEKANQASEHARSNKYSAYDFRSIEKGFSPTGELSVRFMLPQASVQVICERDYLGMSKVGAGLEEYMFAYCLTHLNGQDVSKHKDKLGLLDDFSIEDVQYAVNYFLASSTLNEDSRANLKKSSIAIRQQFVDQLAQQTVTAPNFTIKDL